MTNHQSNNELRSKNRGAKNGQYKNKNPKIQEMKETMTNHQPIDHLKIEAPKNRKLYFLGDEGNHLENRLKATKTNKEFFGTSALHS